MKYTVQYTDERGNKRNISITEADSFEALKNDYMEIIGKYNPKYVTIQRTRAKTGEAMHLIVNVKAPSHYLVTSEDTMPKACNLMSVDIIAYPGYPLEAVRALYPSDHYLASPNVFRSGHACIDNWVPFTSSLTTVVDKLVNDMIHNPIVTKYNSVANREMVQWHKDGVATRRFPTMDPKLLYTREATHLPPRGAASKPTSAPPLPKKRY